MTTQLTRLATLATGAVTGVGLFVTTVPGYAAAQHATPHRQTSGVALAHRQAHLSPAELVRLRRWQRRVQAHHQPAPTFAKSSATTFHVDTTEDSDLADPSGTTCVDAATGHCSLRAAVDAANNLGSPVKVVLAASTYTFTSGEGILVTNPGGTSIVGQGRHVTTLAGTGTGSVVTEESAGVTTVVPPLLFLTGVTLTGGSSPLGGGVDLVDDVDAALVLDRVSVTGNQGLVGGGLRAGRTSKLYATHTSFTDNAGAAGGGLATSRSQVDLTGVTIAHNVPVGGLLGEGGGWDNEFSVAQMRGGTISGNRSGDDTTGASGGGLFDLLSHTTLTGVSIEGNTATSPQAQGGGIWASESQLDVVAGTISHNGASGDRASGGGVYAGGAQVALHGVTLSGDRVSDSAAGEGGAIFATNSDGPAEITVDRRSTVTHANAGAVYVDTGLGLVDLAIDHARLAHNTNATANGLSGQGCGGAVCAHADLGGTLNLTLAHATLVDNASTAAADDGSGAIGVVSEGDSVRVHLNHSTFEGNVVGAHGLGGALGVSGDLGQPVSVRSTGNTFAHNRSGSPDDHGWGGAIGIRAPTAFSDTGSTFAHNRSVGDNAYGGAYYSDSEETSRFTRTTFTANSSGPRTGGDGHGGAVFVDDQAGSAFSQVTVTHNYTATYGGGIDSSAEGFDVSVEGSTIAHNTAGNAVTSGYGGGIYAFDAVLTVENSPLAGNRARQGTDGFDALGGGVFSDGSTLGLRFSTLTGNLAHDGGGVWSEILPGTVLGSIVAGNHRTDGHEQDCEAEADRPVLHSLGGNVLGQRACVTAPGPGDRFRKNARLRRLHANGGPTRTIALRPTSPAVGIGTYLCPSTDQRGRHRPATHCDAGAFELP